MILEDHKKAAEKLKGANLNLIYKSTKIHPNTLRRVRKKEKAVSTETIKKILEYFKGE